MLSCWDQVAKYINISASAALLTTGVLRTIRVSPLRCPSYNPLTPNSQILRFFSSNQVETAYDSLFKP